MEYKKEVELDNNQTIKRDYDKEPIVIRDYSRLFAWIHTCVLCFISLGAFIYFLIKFSCF